MKASDRSIDIIQLADTPAPADGGLTFLPMPTRLPALPPPTLPEEMPVGALAVARDVLGWLARRLADYQGDQRHYPIYTLSAGQQAQSQVLDQLFAEGEVSARVLRGDGEIRIQETLFAGVWRTREYDGAGRLLADRVEICPVPFCVWGDGVWENSSQKNNDNAHNEPSAPASGAQTISLPAPRPNMMNGHFIANEIRARLQQHPPHPHVINLSLLPVNEADTAYLTEFLGEGHSAVFSRGYGKCRIVSSRFPGLWRIHYFNDNNVLLQDMIEFTSVPEIVLASGDDFALSRMRIEEVLRWLNQPAAASASGDPKAAFAPGDNAPSIPVWPDLAALLAPKSISMPASTPVSTPMSTPAPAGEVAYFDPKAITSPVAPVLADEALFSNETLFTNEILFTDNPLSTNTPLSANTASTSHALPDHAVSGADFSRMECKICWWIYDPAIGDDVWQIPPGTPFAALPRYWRCPNCDADKSGFMQLAHQGKAP